MISELIALERVFWGHVQSGEAPPADGSDSADRALRCLYPNDSGQTLDFTGDLEMSATFSDLVAVRDALAQHLKREADLKQRIQQRMGEASRALFEGGDVSWKRSKDASSFDLGRLLRDRPELAVTYAKTAPGTRRFLVNT
jgi:predicted phage-related endonuclease